MVAWHLRPGISCCVAIPPLFAIVRLSLLVSLSATLVAAIVALPAGAYLALVPLFRGGPSWWSC